METKHTPGTWECVDSMSVRGPYCMGDPDRPGYLIAALPTSTPPDERKANARLIAESPNLLKVLQVFVEYGYDREMAIKAIAKATGEA